MKTSTYDYKYEMAHWDRVRAVKFYFRLCAVLLAGTIIVVFIWR